MPALWAYPLGTVFLCPLHHIVPHVQTSEIIADGFIIGKTVLFNRVVIFLNIFCIDSGPNVKVFSKPALISDLNSRVYFSIPFIG